MMDDFHSFFVQVEKYGIHKLGGGPLKRKRGLVVSESANEQTARGLNLGDLIRMDWWIGHQETFTKCIICGCML